MSRQLNEYLVFTGRHRPRHPRRGGPLELQLPVRRRWPRRDAVPTQY